MLKKIESVMVMADPVPGPSLTIVALARLVVGVLQIEGLNALFQMAFTLVELPAFGRRVLTYRAGDRNAWWQEIQTGDRTLSPRTLWPTGPGVSAFVREIFDNLDDLHELARGMLPVAYRGQDARHSGRCNLLA